MIVFLLVFALFKSKLQLNLPRAHSALSKSCNSAYEQHPQTLPVYLIISPDWTWCFWLAWYCWCAVTSGGLEDTSGRSTNTFGLKNQWCTQAYPVLSVHCKCAFVIRTGFCMLDNVPQNQQSTEMQHVCLRSKGGRGQFLRAFVALGHSGSKGSVRREGRREASPPHEP